MHDAVTDQHLQPPGDREATRVNAAPSRYLWLIGGVLCLSMLLQSYFVLHVKISEDQITQLSMGVEWAQTGHLRPVGQPMSGGGMKPGCLYQLLLGMPLKLRFDYHSPRIAMALLCTLSFVVLGKVLWQAAGPRMALIFLSLYSLSPWMLFHLGTWVDISLLFLPMALHLRACWELRSRAAALPSFLLGAVLVLTAQIHGSFPIFAASALFLIVRRHIRADWRWVAAGLAAGAVTLIPTLLAALDGTLPPLLPRRGYVGLGLVEVYPFLKAIAYWFRMCTPELDRPIRDSIFFDAGWAHASSTHYALRGAVLLVLIVSYSGIILSLMASWWYFVRSRVPSASDAPSQWLRVYSLSMFGGMLTAAALSPVPLVGWHVLLGMTAACLPVAAWIDVHWPAASSSMRWAIVAFVAFRLPVVVILAAGHPMCLDQGPLPAVIRQIAPGVESNEGARR
jgi:hypothetical protein